VDPKTLNEYADKYRTARQVAVEDPVWGDVLTAFHAMEAAVVHGISWVGVPGSFKRLTHDEVLEVTCSFIALFQEYMDNGDVEDQYDNHSEERAAHADNWQRWPDD
jgi:hypothetical protein